MIDNAKDKILITNYKPTKLILRNQSISQTKTLSRKNKTETTLYNNSKKNNFQKSNKTSKTNKAIRTHEYRGVPLQFMEAMRLDVNSTIRKANKFIVEEKKRVIKDNPNLKYYFSCNNKKIREKNEFLKRAYEYKMRKNNLNKNKKNNDDYNLNE